MKGDPDSYRDPHKIQAQPLALINKNQNDKTFSIIFYWNPFASKFLN
jgi:hypothetical protein